MADYTLSPNMSLPVPIVGQDPGPDYATNQNTAFGLVDSHDHSPGKGVPITPSGLNINADLSFGGYNATGLLSSRYEAQLTPLAGATDLGCVYVSGVDLYFNDVNGNQVRMTQSGGVAGSPGSISNLTAPASAAYVAASGVFVWESDANTPADMDGASVFIREKVANGKKVTLSAPVGLSADYVITFPAALPVSTKLLSIDSSGNLTTALTVDNSTLEISGNLIQEKNGGTTRAKLAAAGQVLSSSSGAYTRATNSFADVTNLTSGALVVTGRPVKLKLVPDGQTSTVNSAFVGVSGTPSLGYLQILRDSTVIAVVPIQQPDSATVMQLPPGVISVVDVPAAGTYTYKVQARASAGTTIYVFNCKLYTQEDY